MNQNKKEFYAGMLCALDVVAMNDEETLYREIVNTAGGPKPFFEVAEDYDRQHLLRYYSANGGCDEGLRPPYKTVRKF